MNDRIIRFSSIRCESLQFYKSNKVQSNCDNDNQKKDDKLRKGCRTRLVDISN